MDFVKADIRGRVLRRWLFGCSTIVPRFVTSQERQWSLVNLLQRQYTRLFRSDATSREATIGDLRREGRPAVRFNCTSLTTGTPCYFDQIGFGWYKRGVIEKPIAAFGLPAAYAVSASSAFPPLFPPVEISHLTLSCDQNDFGSEQRLTDGGVYDNLGIEGLIAKYEEGKSAPEQDIPLGSVIISDAEGNFDSDFDTKYSFPVNRNVRASDLLMKRVSVLQLEKLQRNLTGASRIPFVRVKIRESIRDLNDKTVLQPEAQRALINVRTDLDSFTPEEITALVAHGYSKAREALLDQLPDAPQFSWDPLENWRAVKTLPAKEFQRSAIRKWRLWSPTDLISWATGLYVIFGCVLLATPTLLFALRSSVEAERAAAAQAAAAAAKSARDTARGQVLSSAIPQVQYIAAIVGSRLCSGGSNGIPPNDAAKLQARGYNAVRALAEAKLAIANGQSSEAARQIAYAESELNASVDGLQCGFHGS
ncbi:putative acylesterase/phospholipase RssA [Bradyrhizobium japonicum]